MKTKDKINQICFIFPSRKVGGVEVMYTKLAKIFSLKGYKILIVDYYDGYIKNQLELNQIDFKFIEYRNNDQLFFDSQIIYLTSLLFINRLNLNLISKKKVFMWDDHPYNAIMSFRGKMIISNLGFNAFIFFIRITQSKKYLRIKTLLNTLIKEQKLFFMSGYNYMFNKKIFKLKNYNHKILPIPIDICKSLKLKIELKNNEINCSFLGRLDNDKYKLCEELIVDVLKFNNKNSFINLNLYVIGSGEKLTFLKEKYNSTYINFVGKIKNQDLKFFFKSKKVNLSFAIGTSALESAKFSIPTALMRTNTIKNNFKNNYIFLFDSVFGELAINNLNFSKKLNLNKIIDSLLLNSNEISKNCFVYAQKAHAIQNVYEKLSSYINE